MDRYADFELKTDGIRPVDPDFGPLVEYAKNLGCHLYQCSWDFDYTKLKQAQPRPISEFVPDEPVWLDTGRRLWPLKDGRVMSISGWGESFEFFWKDQGETV